MKSKMDWTSRLAIGCFRVLYFETSSFFIYQIFLARTRLIFVLLLFLSLKCRTFTTGIRVENHEQHHERLYWNFKRRIGIVVCDY